MLRIPHYLFILLIGSLSSYASEWQLVFEDSGHANWQDNWFLEGDKATVENSESGMTFTAGPNFREHASHAVLWTKRSFRGDVKIEYDYTRLDSNLKAGVNILYLQATGLGTDDSPFDISLSSHTRAEPWMKHYFLGMNSLHISYATDRQYVAARRYPASELEFFEKDTKVPPVYDEVDLFKPGETWHITATKVGPQLSFVAKRQGVEHAFTWDTSSHGAIVEGRMGFRQMWTRKSRYENIRIFERPQKPNVVAIILDDAGWKDVGYHGGVLLLQRLTNWL